MVLVCGVPSVLEGGDEGRLLLLGLAVVVEEEVLRDFFKGREIFLEVPKAWRRSAARSR